MPAKLLARPIGQVLGAQWQRCSVHFVRDMLGHVPRPSHPLVRGALKQVFAALRSGEDDRRPGREQAIDQIGRPTNHVLAVV